MPAPAPYLTLPGNAADILRHYRDVFGGELTLHTFAEFGRDDGAPDLIAHGELSGPVTVFASDAGRDDDPLQLRGLLLALLGAADAETSRRWFDALASTGEVVSPLVERAWGDVDGQVRDAAGVTWLIGFSPT